MGCASSTPMIATAGSEMLKAATHVAEDATKTAEDAAKDVTQTVGKTIETAKDTVTGLANDLSHAFKEKTDEAKNTLVEKMHFGTNGTAAAASAAAATAAATTEAIVKETETKLNETGGNIDDMKAKVIAKHNDEEEEDEEMQIDERTSRVPTPVPNNDADSLRTTTPEPEIEQALASYHEDSPPTPKPTLAELENLTTELKENLVTTAKTIKDSVEEAPEKLLQSLSEKVQPHQQELTSEPPVEQTLEDVEAKRPSTTEWEKYADMLCSFRKYNPREGFNKRGGIVRKFGQQLNPPAPPGYNTRPIALRQHFANDDESGMSDAYYNSNSSQLTSNRSSARGFRQRFPRAVTTTPNTRRLQREIASLVGNRGIASDMRTSVTARNQATLGRKFDFNPNRSRIVSPLKTRSLSRTRPNSPLNRQIGIRSLAKNTSHLRLSSPIHMDLVTRSHLVSPMHNRSIIAHSRIISPANTRTVTSSQMSSPINGQVKSRSTVSTRVSSPIHTKTFTPIRNTSALEARSSSPIRFKSPIPIKPPLTHTQENSTPNSKVETLSRSSRSSTNNSIVIRSNHSTPLDSRSLSKSSLYDVGSTRNIIQISSKTSRSPSRSEYHARLSPVLNYSSSSDHLRGAMHQPPVRLTSSYQSSPRASPFSIRKEYSDYSDKENRASFVAELSSVTDGRKLLSPYKIRERCAVCFNKYVIQ